MRFIDCKLDKHGDSILQIFNHAIATSTSLYDYQPRTEKSMQDWFATKEKGNFPVIGIEAENGELMGFASYGIFRPHAAYQYTVEHSLYVHSNYRGNGLGKKLLSEIIERARRQNLHLMIGVIDSTNTTSVHLHKSLGFTYAGTLNQVGYKFERWLDADFYQLALS
ncbi:acetyltransferase, GNAT family [Verrucomicrobiia bacterium DG1235]|nr:acetyltransferase, GNAT family [Verrucomicrobiae bacterium DG1235]